MIARNNDDRDSSFRNVPHPSNDANSEPVRNSTPIEEITAMDYDVYFSFQGRQQGLIEVIKEFITPSSSLDPGLQRQVIPEMAIRQEEDTALFPFVHALYRRQYCTEVVVPESMLRCNSNLDFSPLGTQPLELGIEDTQPVVGGPIKHAESVH